MIVISPLEMQPDLVAESSAIDPPIVNTITNDGDGDAVTLNVTPPLNVTYDHCQVFYKKRGEEDWVAGVTFVGTQGSPGDVQQTGLDDKTYYDFSVVALDQHDTYSPPSDEFWIFVSSGYVSEEKQLTLNLQTIVASSPTFQDWVGATGTPEEKLAAAKLRVYRIAESESSLMRPFAFIPHNVEVDHDGDGQAFIRSAEIILIFENYFLAFI